LAKKGFNILLLLLGVLLFVSRVVFLDIFPVGIDHDSTDLILSAKSIFNFGEDISGVPFYKSFFFTKTEAHQAGLPSVLLAPILGFGKLTLLKIRVITLLLNLITIFFISLTVWLITRRINLVVIVALVSFINPWLFFYSRFPTESAFSLLFTSVGIFLFFNDKKFASMLFFVASFYSYYAAKPVVILLVPLLILMERLLSDAKAREPLKYMLLFFLFLLPYFIFSFYPQSTFGRRLGELTILDKRYYAILVDEDRRQSIDNPFMQIFSNKAVFAMSDFWRKYLSSFSPSFLFFRGDFSGAHSFEDHGVMYLFDVLFIFIAVFSFGYLVRDKRLRRLYFMVFGILAVSPVGASLSKEESFLFRAHLLIIPLVILVSLGIFYLLRVFGRRSRRIVAILVTIVYLCSYANFLYFYFFRYPVKRQENYFLGERIAANYLARVSKSAERIIVVSKSPLQMYLQYIIYSGGLFARENIPSFITNYFELVNVIFTTSCPKQFGGVNIVVQSGVNCGRGERLVIQNQRDSGGIFYIYNDKFCSRYRLDYYRREHKLSDYRIENLSDEGFCTSWVAKL